MSGLALTALVFALTALWFTGLGVGEWRRLRDGKATARYGAGSDAGTNPGWFGAVVLTVVAAIAWAGAARLAWRAYLTPEPAPLAADAWGWLALALACLLVAWLVNGSFVRRQFRRGNPLLSATRVRLRREFELRARIRKLADHPDTGEAGITLDDLVDWEEFGYLDAVAAHLAAQPPPRRLAVAVAAIDASLEYDDEDADDQK